MAGLGRYLPFQLRARMTAKISSIEVSPTGPFWHFGDRHKLKAYVGNVGIA
ncbi:hypothetical protein GPAL_1244 [Glaciecola pallidula DSM 14239 = ACAM 615]|uniref:Uncharacterized protein n=1 Tax=Brumicola pallidula DSM 14239 = ACAM 615 TaxID=1121922 RepID=K6ZCN6_9ALTE|nr:hypothetical protein GPAL_1244 [Glaciecola pallidula DSM 14239 = ACAM 615]